MCADDSFSCVLATLLYFARPLTPELLPLASTISHLPCHQLIAFCHPPDVPLISPKSNLYNFVAQCHQSVVGNQRLSYQWHLALRL